MEVISERLGKGWREYWSRRGYERLSGRGGRRRKRVENGGRRRRRLWRMRVGPKIRLMPRMAWAKKMAVWVRDAYVRMMVGVATSGVRGMGGAAYGDAMLSFGRAPIKEYDRKMIVHIYNSLAIAHPHLMLPDPPTAPSL